MTKIMSFYVCVHVCLCIYVCVCIFVDTYNIYGKTCSVSECKTKLAGLPAVQTLQGLLLSSL